MGLSTLIKQIYLQTIGGSAPSGAASAAGDISQMLKYLIANPGGTPQGRWGLPGRFATPIDVTISGNTTLSERINYFKNLTINNGIVLTGVAGGTIIVVEETLTLSNGTSQISCNALGGKGAAQQAANTVGAAGFGGGVWGFDSATPLTITQGQFLSSGAMSATNPVVRARLQTLMAAGGAGGSAAGNDGTAGTAYPVASKGMFASTTIQLAQWELILALMEMMLERPTDDATGGGIGGGGGGSGSGGAAHSSGGTGGTVGSKATVGSGAGSGGPGGSGFGGGGGGGAGAAASGADFGAAGGRGGGVLVVVARTINNAGIISADGAAGSAGDTTGNGGGGGGGGGGGACVLVYEGTTGSGVGTVRANGGAAGAEGQAGAGNGGAGGAGIASSFKIRSGS